MASQSKVMGIAYQVFNPTEKDSYVSLAHQNQQARFLLPNAVEVMNARVYLVDAEKNLEHKPEKAYSAGELQARTDWLEGNVYTGDAIGRCRNKVRILYDCPLLTQVDSTRLTKDGDGRFIFRGIKKFDILSHFDGSDHLYYEEIALLRKRDIFENLRIKEVPLNPFWRALARDNLDLLESYCGAMVLEVQRANRLGISSIMGVDLEDLADGEIRPIVMHGATYSNNAIVSMMNSVGENSEGTHRYASRNYTLIGIEKRLPLVTLNVDTWKRHAEKAPIAGAVCAGLRTVAAIVRSSGSTSKKKLKK